MKKLIFALLLLFTSVAHAAEPNHTLDGLIGNHLPKYLWRVPFVMHNVHCDLSGIETTVKLRMYWKPDFPVRGDLMIGEVFIGHYLPVIKTLVTLDMEGVITKAEKINVFSEQRICEFAGEVVK